MHMVIEHNIPQFYIILEYCTVFEVMIIFNFTFSHHMTVQYPIKLMVSIFNIILLCFIFCLETRKHLNIYAL